MRSLLRPLLLPLLRRDPGEIDEQAKLFRIEREGGHALVTRLGHAFLDGYNTMLEARTLPDVARCGLEVERHFRPFFFEGAAMGYLPRSYFAARCRADRAEHDLLALAPGFRYLYYVGLGFWFGFRHRKKPESLMALEPHIDPLFFPLCFDGYGFKTGFFDYAKDPLSTVRLERCPEAFRRFAYQGFGRSMFFVYMDDPAGFDTLCDSLPPERRADLEIGRSLACGFTGVDRPEALMEHIARAAGEEDLGARLTGVTWALTARRMNDPVYFERCLAGAGEHDRRFLERLPAICGGEQARSSSYADWQIRTRDALMPLYSVHSSERRARG